MGAIRQLARLGGGGLLPFPVISNLLARYDLQDLNSITVDGSNNIGQLNDKSGNNYHLTQSTTGNKPVLAIDVSGKRYLQLRSGKELKNTNVVASQPLTIFVVGKLNQMAERNILLMFGASNGTGVATSLNSLAIVAGVTWIGSAPSLVPYTKSINMLVYASSGYDQRVNSTPHTLPHVLNNLAYGNPGSLGITQLHIGSLLGSNYNTDSSANYDLYELIIYSRKLNDTEQSQVFNYLHQKYAIVKDDYLLGHGDSIMQGAQASPLSNGFFNLIGAELGKRYINLGVSGATIANLQSYYQQNVLGPNTGWAIFHYGTNDLVSTTWRDSYKTIIQDYINSGYNRQKILLLPAPYLLADSSKYLQIKGYLETIINDLNLHSLIDVVGYFQANGGDSLMADASHPSTAGHRIIADYLKTYIS